MRLKILVIIVATFLLIDASAQKKDNDLIKWSASKLLTWNDFKARPNKVVQAYAQTGTQITFGFTQTSSHSFTITIQSYFNPKDSWVKEESDYLLNHEQKHADISELFARKIRKKLSETRFKSADDLVTKSQKIYEELMKELQNYQKNYDRETNHSLNKSEQEKWDLRITEELEKLSDFTLSEIIINLA